jgi:hypothetical protein
LLLLLLLPPAGLLIELCVQLLQTERYSQHPWH